MSTDKRKGIRSFLKQPQCEFWAGKPTSPTARFRRLTMHRRILAAFALSSILTLLQAGCDRGLVPPEEPPVGSIRVTITYESHPHSWPPEDSLQDLRFVAMRFVPRDTTDFLNLHRIVFSDRLEDNVPGEVILLDDIAVGAFLYSGIAQKYGPGLFAWRPVGLYDGVFHVRAGETTEVPVNVDFRNPPPFPPEGN
jgi:hypothetical protein